MIGGGGRGGGTCHGMNALRAYVHKTCIFLFLVENLVATAPVDISFYRQATMT